MGSTLINTQIIILKVKSQPSVTEMDFQKPTEGVNTWQLSELSQCKSVRCTSSKSHLTQNTNFTISVETKSQIFSIRLWVVEARNAPLTKKSRRFSKGLNERPADFHKAVGLASSSIRKLDPFPLMRCSSVFRLTRSPSQMAA